MTPNNETAPTRIATGLSARAQLAIINGAVAIIVAIITTLTSLRANEAKVGVTRDEFAKMEGKAAHLSAPIGTILSYGGPARGDEGRLVEVVQGSGWYLCNGAAISRTSFSALFQAVDTSWGKGDNSQTFNLPDLRGVFLRGVNHDRKGDFADPDAKDRKAIDGRTAGNEVGTYQGDEFRSHNHTIGMAQTASPHDNGVMGAHGHRPTVDTQAKGGTETRPKNAYVNFIIKAR